MAMHWSKGEIVREFLGEIEKAGFARRGEEGAKKSGLIRGLEWGRWSSRIAGMGRPPIGTSAATTDHCAARNGYRRQGNRRPACGGYREGKECDDCCEGRPPMGTSAATTDRCAARNGYRRQGTAAGRSTATPGLGRRRIDGGDRRSPFEGAGGDSGFRGCPACG